MNELDIRLGLQQRVLPEYRVPFLESLACVASRGMSVFAGQPRPVESIKTDANLSCARFVEAKNLHLGTGSFYTCVQTNFLDWLNQWQPDALIVEANPRYLTTPHAIHWMHTRKRPVIGWGLGAPRGSGLEAALRRRFLHSLDAIVAYSNTGAEQYVQQGIAPERVFVAANAVAHKPTQEALQRPLHYAHGKPTLLYVGRLQQRKRLDVLIQACALLPESLQPRLMLVGDGPVRAELEALAARVYPSAEFAGAHHGQELEPFYAAADLFVLPGTGGLAVQQAMAHSLPVLVGEADGTQSELVRPENGWILNDMTPAHLAAALERALLDLPCLRQMGLVSYRVVAEEVNIEKMVESFTKAIQSVL
ncbi:D-inositol-3-phosphate glycosyltransferase [bioreactor metagenome]|uniref:D-inositol-3-phosphate glycosyltransferase n=1 Tax=bioreactor metagenome TaxID=1076179 RepID=A0A644ZKN2_9ZZZZ